MKEFGHMINDECFRTLLVEAVNIVNSRPSTFSSSDPDECEALLTPNTILTMKSKQGRSQNFQRGGGSPSDTNNYDRFDAPIALNRFSKET